MNLESLPSGDALQRRSNFRTLLVQIPCFLMIAAYVHSLVRLTTDQWIGFFLYGVPLLAVLLLIQRFSVDPKWWNPIKLCLDRIHEGNVTRQELREGFAKICDVPRYSFIFSCLWWTVGGLLVSVGVRVFVPGITNFTSGVVLAAAATGGVVATIFQSFVTKRLLAPVRDTLAAEIESPDERDELVKPFRLGPKLLFCVTSLTLVTGIFSILSAYVYSARSIEEFAVRSHAKILERVIHRIERPGPDAVHTARAAAVDSSLSTDFVLLNADASSVIAGDPAVLLPHEIGAIHSGYRNAGTSLSFDSANAFAWRRLGAGGPILVAYSPGSTHGPAVGRFQQAAVALVLAALIALVVAYLLADDVGRATAALREQAGRVADGNLTTGHVFESEDELGDLARAFQRMATSLRVTVSRVVDAADGVENAAAEIASVGDNVAEVTVDQIQGIQEAVESMERINAQVNDIAQSSQALNASVEESSSSVLELGAIGEQLNQNALVLTGKVDEASNSTTQMMESIDGVSTGTDGLVEAATDTSESMEAMAASVREVESNASETARLSESVIQMADAGREKVLQTIRGMEAIREATDTAQSVIHNLGQRTSDISAIVEVIDDVADETNLLALNAAIIAAQAGDHGRSFSVVADEIKELADRVLASTKEIEEQIREVQQESANAVGAIERGFESVQGGVDLSAQAGIALEEITDAARGSGERIADIVAAVQEQAVASSTVVGLMDRVQAGVEQIRRAVQEQERSNHVALGGCATMREVAAQVHKTTDEQARGSRRISESIESIRETMDQINRALQEQSLACREAAGMLVRVNERTGSNEESTKRMREAMRGLLNQAETLREGVRTFRV